VHALPVSHIRVQFAKHKKDIQQHSLRLWLTKVYVVGHASVDILHDFGTQCLVLS